MANHYEHYKNLYNAIKPIRGRSEDVRPIGERRRDWELIEMDGDVVACRLYQTHVVRYYPDGRIGLQCGGWETPSTADFIHTHSPWQCYKRNNKLWVIVPSATEKYLNYPIPRKGELQFEVKDGRWQPVGDVLIEKRVVNRAKAKEARAPYKPFLDWAKMFLKMSDGWIMHETRKQAVGFADNKRGVHYTHLKKELMEMMRGDGDNYLTAMCHLLMDRSDAVESRVAETVPYEVEWDGGKRTYTKEYCDMRFKFELLKNRVYRMVEETEDIHDTVRVGVTSRAQSGVI